MSTMLVIVNVLAAAFCVHVWSQFETRTSDKVAVLKWILLIVAMFNLLYAVKYMVITAIMELIQ